MYKSGFIKLNKKKPNESKTEVKKTPKTVNERGVVFISHIPHGFYENEMKKYFSQFGKVTHVNLIKSKKTGKSRGFGFIEFLYPEVAKVVAETMNNYLMHKKILKVKYLTPDEVKKNTFWRKDKIPLTIKNRIILKKDMDAKGDPIKIQKRLSKRYYSYQKKLENKGLEYEIQTFVPKSPKDGIKVTQS